MPALAASTMISSCTIVALVLLSSNGSGITFVSASAGVHAEDTIVSSQANAIQETSYCGERGWDQVWADEFDGSTLDEKKWQITLGVNGGQLRDAYGTADNVYIEKGNLVLRSKAEKMNGMNWTSGAVTSKGKGFWSHGRLCVSAILPGNGPNASKGIWPAHWMMPNDTSCWPDHGEIDIMEMINGDGYSHGTYHWSKDYPAKKCMSDGGNTAIGGQVEMASTWDSAFNEYAVEYDLRGEGYVAFVVNSKVLINITKSSTPKKSNLHPEFIDTTFYAILNTAVGGPWPGQPNAQTQFPTYHRIDYVRVAQRA
eukprot:m.523222 g.523222  ORF g.523222 m.523222 type:complete len:312 (-) comp21976_c0_seq3:396-1331(-)